MTNALGARILFIDDLKNKTMNPHDENILRAICRPTSENRIKRRMLYFPPPKKKMRYVFAFWLNRTGKEERLVAGLYVVGFF